MLEIPESHTVARQLQEVLPGKRIDQVIAGFSPHGFAFYYGDPADYPTHLETRTVGAISAIAGRVAVQIDHMRLVFGDGVNIRYLPPETTPPKKHQLYLRLDDGSAICCSVQMYGEIQAFPEGAMDDNFYYRVGEEKPSPLTDAFDRQYFESLLSGVKPSLSAKAFLATEQRIPGLGNGVLQDILFHAGIHPKTKLAQMSDGDFDRLYSSVKQTLAQMTEGGGRDTEKDIYGNPGGYPCILSKKTLPYPCPQCGSGLVKQAYLGGAVYFCPICQPLNQ